MAENNFGKGIKVTSGFDLNAKLPLDNRDIVKTLEERDAHVTNNRAYEGMKVYVLDEKKEYIYNGTEWTEQGGISDEQLEQLTIAYQHSQSKHVTIEDIHTHDNKSVLDNITQEKVDSWDNKSEFDGNYNNLTNKPIIPTKTSELTNDSSLATETYVINKIAEAELNNKEIDLSGYATKDELPTKTSQLTNDSNFITSIPSEYVTDTELNSKNYATKDYVDNAIDEVDVTEQLVDYAKKSELPTKTSELTNDSNFLTSIPSEYITETELTAKGYLTEHQSLEGYAKTSDLHTHDNKSVLDGITSEKVSEWNNTIDRIELTDSEQLVFYSGDTIISRIQLQKGMTDEEKEELNISLATKFDDVAVNENETNDMQTALDFYSEGEIVKTVYFTGGSGGSSTSAYISTELEENVMVGTDESFNLTIDFVSPNPGKGTLKVFINDVEAVSKSVGQGESTTTIEGAKFTKGTNRVTVYVIDRVGVMSNSLTFYIRYGSTEISSDFDAYSAYDYGATIRYYFTPTAIDTSLTLTFYMSIDGQVQQGVACTSDTRGYYTFPTNLSADSHYCEAYIIDSNGIKSNVLSFNLIILNTNTLVVASDTKETTIEEGEQLSLDYKVYMKNNTSFITKVYVDNNLVNTGTCNADFNYYRTSSLTEGMHTIKLEVWDVTETYHDYVTWTITVTPSTYEMKQPVNAGAMFIGTAVNKTNTDERKQYFIGQDQEGNEILGTLTNFAFNSESGWVDDELIISGNSYAEIPIQPLANNAKYGFTLDIEFTSKQIGVPDAEVLTLWNDETNCGVKITTEKLILRSSNGNQCDLYFTDNERTHVMFIIDRQELKAKIYLNGVMCEAFHLNDYTVDGVAYLDDFTVNSNIVLGGLNTNGYCKIRNIRVYQVALTTDEIINNFISCEIDKSKQRELVNFQKGDDLPTLYVYCDFSGLGKDDKKPCKIVYNSTNEELYGKSFNLDHKQSQLQYQGTSSMAYPIKNYRLNLRDENGDKWYYTLPTAQPECRFTLKADFMSSGHWTNTGMAKFINDKLYNYNVNDEKSMNPFKWEHVQNGGKVSDFRETIHGFPCRLILVNDGETPLNTGQNEPTPGNTKDMGIFNFNNDKDNVTTLGFNSDIFPNCASYEVTANSDTSAGAFMSYSPIIPIDYYHIDGDYSFSVYLPSNLFLTKDTNIINSDVQIVQIDYHLEDKTWKDYKSINNISATVESTEYSYIRIKFLGIPSYITFNDIRYPIGNQVSDNYATFESNISPSDELAYLKESFELRHPDEDDVAEDWGFMGIPGEEGTGLKALIDWVDNCTDEEFVRDFEQHFHKDYTLRYFCLVTLIGAVDNLGGQYSCRV